MASSLAPLLLLSNLQASPAASEVETLRCDVVVAGGSAASLAAALTAAGAAPRHSVCLTDPTDWPGGQLTASAVSAIDGPILSITGRTGHELMSALGSPRNPGGCWVSTMCYEPGNLVRDYVIPAIAKLPNLVVLNRTVITATEACKGSSQRICALHAIQRVPRNPSASPDGEWSPLLSESLGDWYSAGSSERFDKRPLRITGDVFVEATEFGDVLMTGAADPALQLPFVQGIEEPLELSHGSNDQCGQAATQTFYTRIVKTTEAPSSPPVPPGSTGDGMPFDIPNDGNQKPLPSPWAWDDIWTYRRARLGATAPPGSHSPAHGGTVYVGDVTQQNWGGGNDLEGGYLWLPVHEALAEARAGQWTGGINTTVLSMLEQRAYGWFRYYKNHSHLSKSSAALRDGTATVLLDRTVAGTQHGLAKMPYLRDTRRSVGLDGFRLQYTYESLANVANRSSRFGVRFPDTVAIGKYGHDTHGLAICTIPAYVLDAPSSKPYYIPFRALTNGGAENLLVCGKTMAASFSANSATRLHPEEWSTGVAAGAAAALLVSNAHLNTTRDILLHGMQKLIALLKSPEIAQPLEWTTPPPPPPTPLTWKCELSRCIGVSGGGNSTTCNGLCAPMASNEWLANLNYWRAAKTDPGLLVATHDTELKKSTTQSDSLPDRFKLAVKQGATCRRDTSTRAGAFEGYVLCTYVGVHLRGF